MTRARALATLCVAVTVAVLGAFSPAQASLTQITQSTQIFANPTLIKFDAAYNPVNKVYLVVWGKTQPGPITGIFLNSQGQPISGGFDLSVYNGYTSGWARVVYGAQSGFMVTYTKSFGNPVSTVTLMARFLRYSANGPVYGSGEIEVQQLGANHPGSDEGVAYVSSTGTYISAFWVNPAFPQSFIKGVRPEGLTTGAIPVTDGTDGFSDPEVSCDATSNRCLVVGFSWGSPFIVGGKYTGASWGRLIDATTLQPIGTTNTYISGGARAENQGVVFSPAANQFVVGWVQGYDEILGRSVDPNFGQSSPYVMRTGSGTTNGNDCAFGYGQLNHAMAANSGTGTLAIAAVNWCGRASIQELNANGTPTADFKLVDGLVTIENNPVVVANNDDKQYLFLHNYQVAAPRSVLYGADGPGGGGGNPPPPPPPPTTIDLSPAAAPNGSWYLAEGAASSSAGGFSTYYLLGNENPGPINVRVYFASDDGRLLVKNYTVPADSRYTIDLRNEVGAGSFATVFQSTTANADVYVERSVYWGNNFEGSTGATAIKSLGGTWMFPEGSRGNEYLSNFFLLFNPQQAAANIIGQFFLPDGTVVTKTYVVGAQARLTLNANLIPELAGKDFSSRFYASQPIMAERAMYLGAPWIGGTASVGVGAPWHTWHFAEGAAQSRFETFYLIQNTNPVPITVNAFFFQEAGPMQIRAYQVPANSRYTVYLNAEFGNVGGLAATFTTAPDTPIVVERAVYWGLGRIEGTTAIGMPAGAYEWHLPKGTTGGRFDTFLLMSNPHELPVAVDVTVFVEGVGKFTAPVSMRPVLGPYSRKTINMRDFLTQLGALEGVDLANRSFATRVKVFGNVRPIVVEHAIYYDYTGPNYWRGGSGGFGIPR